MHNHNDNIKNIMNDDFKEHMNSSNHFSLLSNLPNICKHFFHQMMSIISDCEETNASVINEISRTTSIIFITML